MTRYEVILKSGKSVFTVSDLVSLWELTNRRDAIESVKDYVRRGRLIRIQRGIYVLDRDYDVYELAQKLITPSYISYYTALNYNGVSFQHYSTIYCFSFYNKKTTLDSHNFFYHKVSEDILLNHLGVIQEKNYSIAGKERAICDSLYINKYIGFDNLREIDKDKLLEISRIYKNSRLESYIDKLVTEI